MDRLQNLFWILPFLKIQKFNDQYCFFVMRQNNVFGVIQYSSLSTQIFDFLDSLVQNKPIIDLFKE